MLLTVEEAESALVRLHLEEGQEEDPVLTQGHPINSLLPRTVLSGSQ
jgi:hypothetical protein